jgi:hypothetical protein
MTQFILIIEIIFCAKKSYPDTVIVSSTFHARNLVSVPRTRYVLTRSYLYAWTYAQAKEKQEVQVYADALSATLQKPYSCVQNSRFHYMYCPLSMSRRNLTTHTY